MMRSMSALPELPSTLAKSPHFQVERVRRHTKDEVERTLAKHTSTMREYWILTCVDGEPMSQRQLSELLSIDASDMVRLIDNLENNNWVAADVAEAEDRALEASSNKQLKSLRKLSQALAGEE